MTQTTETKQTAAASMRSHLADIIPPDSDTPLADLLTVADDMDLGRDAIYEAIEDILPGDSVAACSGLDNAAIVALCDREGVIDEAQESLHAAILDAWDPQALGIGRNISYTVLLTCGGPTVYFTLEWSPACEEWTGGTFTDTWAAPQTCELDSGDAEAVAEAYGIYPGSD